MSDPVIVPSFLQEVDLGQVDTTIPVINGPITEEVEITELSLVKAESGIDQLKIVCKTVKDLQSTRKQTINAGFPLYANIGLTPLIGRDGKKDRTEEFIRRDVAKFVQALGEAGSLLPLERFIGKRAMVKITVRPAKDKWPETNDIDFVKMG